MNLDVAALQAELQDIHQERYEVGAPSLLHPGLLCLISCLCSCCFGARAARRACTRNGSACVALDADNNAALP